jgi:hypothetical protein
MEEIEIDPEKFELMKERAVQIRKLVANPTLEQKRSVFETERLECIFRHNETGDITMENAICYRKAV